MAKKFLTHLDLAKNELQNAVIQQLGSAPSSPVQGQIYYNTGDDNLYIYDGAGWVDLTVQGGGGGDASTNTSSSVDGEIVLFSGTGGKTLKRATGSGIAKITSGVLSTATAGTDYTTPSSTESFTNKTFDANGSGNSISNLETADFAANVVDNDSTLTANSSSRLPTQQAVKGYVDNAVQGLSWKQAVRAASTAPVTLATAFENGDTIDGVVLATGDRILIKDQSAAAENGIYVVNASGAPTRAADANSAAELINATVYVSEGTTNAETVWTCTNNATINLGTTGLSFAQVNGGTVPQATTSVQGKVELATQAETEAKSDTERAVTPASLASFVQRKIFTIGDNSATQIDVTHSLGTKEVITQVRQASDDAVVECDITNLSTTVVRLNFAVAPATNAIKVVVIG
jgi:hypothetical protein